MGSPNFYSTSAVRVIRAESLENNRALTGKATQDLERSAHPGLLIVACPACHVLRNFERRKRIGLVSD